MAPYNIGHKYLVVRGKDMYIAVYTPNIFVPQYKWVVDRWMCRSFACIPSDEFGLIVTPRSSS